MKKTISLFVFLVIAASSFAQTKADYDAVVKKYLRYYALKETDSIYALFGDRIKNQMTLVETGEKMNQMNEQFGAMLSAHFTSEDENFHYYRAEFAKGTLTLVVGLTPDNKLNNFRFTPYRNEQETALKEKSKITLKTPTGDISGTIAIPGGSGKVPVVLIVAGSGPTDRDGNSPALGLKADTYHLLADALLHAGIASVRYDKRGVGESAAAMKNEESLRFDDLVDDAAGYIKMLKEDPRFSKVIVLGHSEGSLIGMMAAKKEKAAAFISVSGLGERADKTLEKQMGKQSEELGKKSKIAFDSLIMGYIVKNVDPELNALLRPTIQPYIMSWLRYDPAVEIGKLSVPVLILQGNTDIQVDVEEADKLKKAYPRAQVKIITEMNHVLKQSTMNMRENVSTYTNSALPLCPGLTDAIVNFIK